VTPLDATEEALRRGNEAIERMQDERLRHMLDLCARGHPYYRRVWGEAGIDVSRVRGVADLHMLPVTPKTALMAEPEDFRLCLDDLPLHERALWDVIYTTGSTGEPTPIYNTTHDYHAYLFQSRRVAQISGVRADDVIANLFPLTPAPMGAFVRATANAFAAGASVFAVLPGARHGAFDIQRGLDEAVEMVASHRASVLWGVPSYVRRVLVRADELGFDLPDLRMCAVAGEASTPAMREELRSRMRAVGSVSAIVFDRYGSTELGAFAQCEEDSDWHNPSPEIQYHEVVDPQTGVPLVEGARGHLAVTHLDRRGTVLIRFIVGDVVGLERTPCPRCGRYGDRVVGPVARGSDLVKIKGMLVNPSVMIEHLGGMEAVEDFQIVVQRARSDDPFSGDRMLVRVAADTTDRIALEAAVVDAFADAVRVRPEVEFVDRDEIFDPRTQTKAKRFIDQR